MKTCLASWFVPCLIVAMAMWPAAAGKLELGTIEPLVRVVDLDVGESADVELCDGSRVQVRLVSLDESRDPIRHAVRHVKLVVEIDGQTRALEAGPYRLPVKVGDVQVDCSVTRGLNSNGTPAFWGLGKDARLRFWPKDSPLFRPGTIIYPVKQDWFATRTWFDNEVVDGGPSVRKQIYYHAGMDIGASEALCEVIAATDALVVQRGTDVLEGHAQDTPATPRYDVVYLLDARGWYYRYSHLKEIARDIRPGRVIRKGELVGLAGKEGDSGGWSHLHFEIKSRQPSGEWGTQAAFALLRQAYLEEFDLKLYANARPAHFLVAGEETTLDGTRSWSAAGQIESFQWTLHDQTTATGAKVPVTYTEPGSYCEVLKVTDGAGNTAFDFAHVCVLDPDNLTHYPPNVNANFHPTRDLHPGDEITFKARAFRMQGGQERWDFGDGSPVQTTRSPETAEPHAEDAYAEIKHRYASPGQYIVSVSRTHANGQTATHKLCVTVDGP